jgi:peptidoglycan/LPS O-acetylase OafA/YrhL
LLTGLPLLWLVLAGFCLQEGAAVVTLEDRFVAVSGRGPAFDHVRLVAAGVVLMHHCWLTQHSIRDPLFLYSGGFVHFGIFAVLIFFSLSGFLVVPGLMRTGNVVPYAINRALRIFPALTAVVIGTMLLVGPALTSMSWHDYFTSREFWLYAKNILTSTYNYLPGVTARSGGPVVVNGALWTLHFEVLAYVALAFMSVAGVLARRAAFLAILAVCYSLYLLIAFGHPLAQVLPGRFTIFVTLFTYFSVGSGYFLFRDRVPFSGGLAGASVAIMLAAFPLGLGPVTLPICLPYAVIFIGLSSLAEGVPLRRDISYGVYLIHAPTIAIFLALLPDHTRWWLLALIVAAATSALAYCCRILVEEPALRRKKPLFYWVQTRLAPWRQARP